MDEKIKGPVILHNLIKRAEDELGIASLKISLSTYDHEVAMHDWAEHYGQMLINQVNALLAELARLRKVNIAYKGEMTQAQLTHAHLAYDPKLEGEDSEIVNDSLKEIAELKAELADLKDGLTIAYTKGVADANERGKVAKNEHAPNCMAGTPGFKCTCKGTVNSGVL